LEAPPVKDAAVGWNLAVSQPRSGEDLFDAVQDVSPDVAVVAAYGRLIKPDLLELPQHGFLNVHYSLLPRWRGASPVVRAILAGDQETGVSLMKMDVGLDTGPVIATVAIPIDSRTTAGMLTERLAMAGAALLVAELPRYLAGEIVPVGQTEDLATAAAKVTTDEAHIDPIRHSAEAVDLAVRAFNPKPGAWCTIDEGRIKIWKTAASTAASIEVAVDPGEVRVVDARVVLGTRTGPIELLRVQPAGKPEMDASAWMNGRRREPALLR
jgi:methionyl-tRNA formyltransferase